MRKGFLRTSLQNAVNKVSLVARVGGTFAAGMLLFGKPVCAQTPTITTVTPVVANNGAAVSISGTNFNATTTNNIVYFGATRATVNSATTTSLNVTVPVGSIFAPVTVNNTASNLMAFAPLPFLPTFSGPVSVNVNAAVNFAVGNSPYDVCIGDIDGDGKSDIVAVNYNSASASVLRNTSTSGSITAGSFASAVSFTTGSLPTGVAAGDIDGDGKPDVIVANNSGSVSVLRNTSTSGSVSFAAKVDFGMASGGSGHVSVADFDGDGRADICITNFSSTHVSVFRNTSAPGSITFAARQDFTTGSSPWQLSVGDIDGDGKTDMIVGNYGSGSISLFRNISVAGSISFSPKVDFGGVSFPLGVSVADIDGDSKLDIVTCNAGGSIMSVFRNTATIGAINSGSLASAINFASGSGPWQTTIADVTGDGKPDVITANTIGSVSVFRNTATSGSITSGSFAAKVDFPTGVGPFGVAAGDLDGDGGADIVTANNGSTNVSVLRNTGVPVAPSTPAFTGSSPQYLSVCQNSSTNSINSLLAVTDGDVGQTLTWTLIVPATNGTVTMGGTALSNGATVTPTGYSYTPLSGFAGNDAFSIQISDGTGGTTFTTIIVTVNPAPTTITGTTTVCRGLTTTLNSTPSGGTWTSGNPAVATVGGGTGIVTGVASGTANITYTLGSCITFTTVTVIGTPVVSGLSSYVAAPGASITISGSDFNASTTNNIVYFGATRATVTSASNTSLSVTVPIGATYMPIVSVENTACAFTGYSQNLFLPTYNNAGFVTNTVNFDPHVSFTSGSGPYGVAVGDIDGDGKSDVVVANYFSNTISIYRNTSSSGSITSGSLAAKVDFTTAGNPFAIAINDIDGDSKLDVVVSVSGASVVSVFRNTATSGSISAGSLAASVDFAVGANPAGLDVRDIDGDGKPDIVVANTTPNTISVLHNTSTSGSITIGSFAPKVDFTTGATPHGVAIGDIDGDGKPDIAVTNNAANTVSLFHNTATVGIINGASLASKVDFATALNPWNIKIADIDGDNKADVTLINYNSNSVSVFRNTATSGSITGGSLAAKVDFTTGSKPIDIAMGDVDGDGKPDIFVTNDWSTSISVLRNTATSGSITSGSLAANVEFGAASFPYGIAVGDIDGDGKTDIIAANSGSNSISVLRNNPLQPITGTLTVCPGTTTTLSNATAGGTWSSSNPAVATVGTGSGIVAGVTLGTADITYAGTAGPSFTDNIVVVTVTVMALPSAITGTTDVCTGATTTLSSATSGGVWSTSNAAVATVGSSTGIVSGHTVGVVTISYTVSTGCYVTTPVTVNQTPTGISGTFSVCVGLTTALSNGYGSGVWTSSNNSVATVGSASGVVTGVAGGNSTITYTLPGNCFVTQQVTVNTNPAAITGTDNVCVGGNVTLSNATPSGLFSSSSTGVATIGGGTGMVTGITAGTTNISYTLTATGCYSVLPFTVNALPAAIGSGTGLVSFSYTGTVQSYTVPAGVTSVTLSVSGAQGGNGLASGGLGANISGVYAVTPGHVLNILVGEQPVAATLTGGGGGGSFIWDVTAGNALLIAAGGGGGSGAFSGSDAGIDAITTNNGTNGGGGFNGAGTGGSGGIAPTGTPFGVYAAGGTGWLSNGASGNSLGFCSTSTGGATPLSGGAGGVFGGNASLNGNGGFGGGGGSQGICSYAGGGGGGGYSGGAGGVYDGSGNAQPGGGGGSYNTGTGQVNSVSNTGNGSASIFYSLPTSVCVGLTITLTNATPGGTWSSSNSGMATIGSSTGIVTGVSAGTPTITYLLPTGCFVTQVITVNPLPAAITGSATVCVGSNVMLTNTTGTGVWSSSNTAEATIGTSSGIVTGVAAGTPTITYTLPTGCIATRVQTVDPLPAAITGVLTACPGTTTTLSNASAGGAWTSNNTSVATIGSGTGIVTGVAAGTSTITYTLPTGCMITAVVTINPNPAAITGTPTLCTGSTTTFASATGGGTWSSSNTGIATIGAATGIATGVSGGTWVCTYTMATGCISTVSSTVNPTPSANSGTPSVCVGLTTTLTNGSGSSTWSSSNASLATVGSGTGIVTGVAAGTLNITFTMPTGCFVITPFTVNPTPAAIGGTPNVCEGATRTLTNSVSGGTWSVSNANATIHPTSGLVTGVTAGTLSVTYTLPAGCTNVMAFTVNATPPANTGTATVCTGLTTTLSNGLAGGSWSSSHTGQATVVSGTGVVTGVSAGNPVITYTVTGACTATTVLTVNPTPSANTGGNNVCVGSSITLANSAGGGSWSASNANATVGTGTGLVTGVTAGTVNITYALPTGCIAVTPMTVNSTPAAITGLPTVCTGQTTSLSSATAGGTWTSSNTAIATVSGTGVVTGVTTGTINITYTTNPGSCFVIWAMTVNQTPPAIVGNSNLCIGVPTPLTNSIGGGLWTSSNSSLASIGSSSGVATGIALGNPVITYTLPGGCFATMLTTVNNQPAAITGSFIVCETLTTTLGNTSSGGLWTSSNSAQASVGSTTGVVTGVSAGMPNITYTLPGGCNSIQQITVNPQPAAVTGTAIVCVSATTTLSSATFGGTWSSSNTSLATVGSSSGIVTGVSAGNPVVSYTLPAGCFSIATMTVNALPTVYTVTGGGAYCAGGTGVAIGVSSSNTGINYQLYRGTVAVGSPVSGTGSSISFGLQTVAGIYSVVATNTTTGCFVGMAGSATVTINPLPFAYTVSGGGSYCAGGSGLHVYLVGSAAFGFTYQLYVGGTTPVGLPVTGTGVMLDFGLHTTAGTYTVVATNTATGCTNTMLGSAVISIDPLPTAYAVTVTGSGAYCAGGIGQQVGLTTSDIGFSYQLFNSGTPVGAPLPGTGSALNFGYQTAAGTYTVVGTNSATSCINSMTGSAVITINPLPTVYSVTLSGSGSYCTGGTGVDVLLSGSEIGVNYLVYLDGVSTGVSLAGTGSALNFGAFTSAGTYTVIATNSVTTCVNTMSGSPVLTINPLPTVFSVTGGGPYCSGGTGVSVGLSSSTIGVSYQLYDAGATAIGGPIAGTGAALDFGLLTPASTYTVVATNASTGCVNNMSGSATVTIDPLPNVYPVLGGGAYCVGGTGVIVELLTSDIGFDYQLYNGITPIGAPMTGTGSLLSFGAQTAAGTYTIHSTDMVTGCVSVMSGSAVVTIDPLPVAYTVTGGGNYCSGGAGVLVGLSGSQAGVDYELYLDGLFTGTTVTGTGGPISFGMQTSAGIYTVEADNPTTTCTNNMTGSATVAIDPLPVAYFVTGGGNYCVGGAGVHVGLSGSNIGFSYQLYDATAATVGGPLAGTGAAIDYGLITAVGTYTVVATNIATGCVNDMVGSATIGTDPLPTVYNVTGGGAYCAGGTGMNVDLDNSDLGTNYQLYKDGVPVGPIVGGSGFPISFGLQTVAGTYTTVATGATGCTENMAGFATIAIDPLPSAYAVTGGGSYCSGGTGVHIGLSGSTSGIEYQLFDGGPVGAPVIGTGLPIDFGLITGTGIYSVIATNLATGCFANMTGSVSVSIDAPPTLHIVSGGGNYCAGGTGTNVFLLSSSTGVNYQLYIGSSPIGSLMPGTGGTLDFGPQTLAGVYTVQGTDVVTGCTSLMALSATVSIDPLPTAYAVTGGGSLCPGGAGVTVGLSNSDIGITYQLLRDGVPEVAPVSGIGAAFDFGTFANTGVYTVLAVSGAGCMNSMTASATVAHYTLPTLYTVTGGGNYCTGGAGLPVSLNGSQAGVDYQLWMGGATVGPVVAGTGSPISFGLQTAIGNYTVMATNPVTTCTDTMYGSANINVNPLPIAQTLSGGGSYCVGGTGVGISMLGSETGVIYQLYNGTMPVGSPIAGTGLGLNFGLYTTAGIYTVVGTNAVTLCATNMANSDTVSISPLPNAYAVTGGGSYCMGGAGVNVGLSSSQTGVNYQLFIGSSPVSLLTSGTGSAITFGIQTTSGIYTIVATNATTLCTKNMTGSVTVSINALPTAYAVTGGGSYCIGGSGVNIGLSGSSTGVKYQLVNGTSPVGLPVNGTGSAITFGMHTATGIYKVVATNSTTLCSNDMAGTVSVAINAMPTAYSVTGSGSSYCAGGTGVNVYISGSQTGVNYQLLRGTTPVGAAIAGSGTPLDFGAQTVAGTYTVVANNTTTGCMSNMTGLVSVSIDPLPNLYTVTGGGNYCPGGAGVHVGLSSSNTGIKYQLYNGGPVGPMVSGTGTAIDFGVLTTTGSYTVIASNSITGCTSNMTGSATIGLNPLPVAFTVTGGGSYCSGGTGVNVGLSGSITGNSYQLYYGSTALGGAVAGTGLPLNFGLQTTAGTYTVKATTTATSCSSNMTGSANVAVNVLPTSYIVTGGGNYCSGDAGVHIGLSNSDAGISYQLYNGTTSAGAPVTGTGTPIDFGVFSATGSYTVVAKNIATLCTSNMTGSVGVGINPLPTVFNVVGGGAYCSGSGGVHVGLSSSSAGVSYELRKDGVPVTVMTGTGVPIDFGLITATGNYTVVATNSTTMCTNSMAGSAVVSVNPTVIPVVTIVSSTGDTMCSGNIGNFSAAVVNGGAAPLYQWAVNGVNVGTASAYSYVPADGDVVSVSVTSSAVCAMPAIVSNSMTITVMPVVTPSVSVSAIPGAIVCAGTVVNYTASYANGGLTPVFEWKKNGVVVGSSAAYTTIPANGDEITCIMTSSNRCVSHRTVSSSFNMIVNDPVIPIVNILASPGLNIPAGLSLTLTADITNTVPLPSYQWSVNGVPVTGATMPQFTSDNFANLDIVTCTVTSGGGCAGSAGTGTVTVRVAGVGVNNIASIGTDIQLIPNPNKGTFNVKGTLSTNTNEEVSMEVTNMLGQSILVRKVDVRNGEINENVQLSSDIANGMYILTLRSEAGNKVFHIVVER